MLYNANINIYTSIKFSIVYKLSNQKYINQFYKICLEMFAL